MGFHFMMKPQAHCKSHAYHLNGVSHHLHNHSSHLARFDVLRNSELSCRMAAGGWCRVGEVGIVGHVM